MNVATDDLKSSSAVSTPTSPPLDPLIDYLATRDVACPVCDYNLRNLTRPCCPECGRQLELSVRATDVPMGIWIAGLVAILPATPFGVAVICTSIMDRNWRSISIHSVAEAWWLALAIYAALAIPAAVILIARRRRFLQMRSSRQGILAAIPIAFDLAAIITLLVEINS